MTKWGNAKSEHKRGERERVKRKTNRQNGGKCKKLMQGWKAEQLTPRLKAGGKRVLETSQKESTKERGCDGGEKYVEEAKTK